VHRLSKRRKWGTFYTRITEFERFSSKTEKYYNFIYPIYPISIVTPTPGLISISAITPTENIVMYKYIFIQALSIRHRFHPSEIEVPGTFEAVS